MRRRSFLVATNFTSAPKHLSSHSPQEEPGTHAMAHGARARAQPDHIAGRCAFKALKAFKAFKTFKTFKAHSGSLSRMQEHRGTGARERVCGDIVRLGSLEAGGWCRRWQALCEVPVRAYRVDGVADGKLSARYPCAHAGWMDNRWQTLCEVPQDRVDGQPMANALRGTRIQVWKSVDSQGLCALCLCTLSVHVVCALHRCTLSVHVVCALHLCTLSVHVVCALWLIPAGRAVIVPLAEETLATWRLPVAIEYQGVLVVRSLLVLVVLTCIAQRVQGRA